MATVVLSAVGGAVGSAIGGSFLGLSMTAVGRAVGAVAGTMLLDRKVGGVGTDVEIEREGRRIDRIQFTRSGEGADLARVWGRMKVSGHVIWASHFKERVIVRKSSVTTRSSSSGGGGGGGGKGSAPEPRENTTTTTTKTREYRYSISLAVAVSEGEIAHVSRIWADGIEMPVGRQNIRVYKGDKSQLPDPLIEAIEGQGQVPAYRGTAYVVFENLDLTPYGNRLPRFSFEVSKPIQTTTPGAELEAPHVVQGVAMLPGSGEYALATSRVHYYTNGHQGAWANVNTPQGRSDFSVSIDQMKNELPNLQTVSLIVSWFGDDLRAGRCKLRPKVTTKRYTANKAPWRVSGLNRFAAEQIIADASGKPVYGGTPDDHSVIEAIHALKAQGKEVVFYPFILMEQMAGNGLPDPYSDAADQPVLPWRGRITTEKAPGMEGSPDGSVAAEAEVRAFFGQAGRDAFGPDQSWRTIGYNGPHEWSFRRFILHYAHLCKLAGGVHAFCIGSEMRGLTQIRGADNSFPAVDEMIRLARDVRAILGPWTKISYAADWSEYFGYHPQDGSGDVYFHLDPLWSDDAIDFIGIDNYMPLSDWREGETHADAQWGSVHNLAYLQGNVAGGEGYDWYYASRADRDRQKRTAITDGAHDEAWVFRYKDLRNWWQHAHHNRIAGVRQEAPTPWVPGSKPFWFTEYGCAAIDLATNQPNKFLDPKSSESALPYFSNGARDELIQRQYLRAVNAHWADPENNPVSEVYGGPMVDMSKALVWAWDARPFPWFPRTLSQWSDGDNYARGHWLNGRATGLSLAALVEELCLEAGVRNVDVSKLYGFVRGYMGHGVTNVRTLLQPLMMHFGFDAIERGGVLQFRHRHGMRPIELDLESLAVVDDLDGRLIQSRAGEAEMSGRVRFDFIEAEGDYPLVSTEAALPDDGSQSVAVTEMPLVLTRAEGRQAAERWLAEARVARDGAQFALPPSLRHIGAGDVVSLGQTRYRVDRVEQGPAQIIDAVRIEPDIYEPVHFPEQSSAFLAHQEPVPVTPIFMDLPLLSGAETPHAPFVAMRADPWPGAAAIYSAPEDAGYELDTIVSTPAMVGETRTPLFRAQAGLIDRGPALEVTFDRGALESVSRTRLLSGANAAVIGDGSSENWEIFQFEQAQLISQSTYLLSGRLRGQAGTDAVMPEVWPVGSTVVVFDGAPEQIALGLSQRGLARHYRIGPAALSVDDDAYDTYIEAFRGIGLRPYRPVHLRARPAEFGALQVSWIRRTRIDGDSWEAYEVPLGEDQERYLVRIRVGGAIVREREVTSSEFTYWANEQSADGFGPDGQIEVAQVSSQFGPGPFAIWSA